MDLGLTALTDDQLFELCQQMCQEFAQRDPMVRSLAQQSIHDEAAKLEAAKEELKAAIEDKKTEYRATIRQEALDAAQKAYDEGTLRLYTPEQEAKLIGAAELEARIALIDEAVKKLKAGTEEKFYCEINQSLITVSFGRNRVQVRHGLSPQAIEEICSRVRYLLTT